VQTLHEWKPLILVHGGLCKPHINEETRERYASDSRFRMERRQHAHGRKRGVSPIPLEGQEIILEEFRGECAYCDSEATTWDHVVPITENGRTTPGNIVPACVGCNSSKKHREVFSWLESTGRVPKDAFFDRIILAECGLWG